jgi:hypothetical protein
MHSRIALTSVGVALAATIATLSFAQHRDAAAADMKLDRLMVSSLNTTPFPGKP